MASSMEPHEGEIATRLDSTNLSAVIAEQEVAHWDLVIGLLAGPLKSLGPGLVAEPVANKVSVALLDNR